MSERHLRFFSRLLRLYPRTFRDRYGARMLEAFAADLSAARQRRFGVARLWIKTCSDASASAVAVRWDEGPVLLDGLALLVQAAQPIRPRTSQGRADRTVQSGRDAF
jgi:hypothetical protein